MYQKHLRIQKFICLCCIIAAALSFIYALGMITDIYDALYSAAKVEGNPAKDKVTGAQIYYHMQDFNKQFVNASVVLILLGCLLFITQTHTRRKYYITNYLAVGAYCIATVWVSIWARIRIEAFAEQYRTTVSLEELLEYSTKWKTLYLDNTNLLDAHRTVVVISIATALALLGNTIWKIFLVRKENELIEAGKEAPNGTD